MPEDTTLPRGVAVPDPSRVLVYFDGACQTVRRRRIAAYGFTIEGAGLVHAEYDLAVPPDHPRATNNVAEYVGAIRALEWLAALPFRGEVVVRGDSELVIRQMNGEYEVKADHLKSYHERLCQLAALFRQAEFAWVPREENRRADTLSKAGIELVRPTLRPPPEPSRAEDDPDLSSGPD